MDIHNLGDTWPAGMSLQSFAGVTAYDEQTLTIKTPDGTPSGAVFGTAGGVGVFSYRLDNMQLCQDWLWLKVGDPTINDDGTQCYPILDRAGHADVKVGAIALYVGGEQE